MTKFTDLTDFNNPIANLLDNNAEAFLTPAARQLLKGDLVALAWRNHTARTEQLTPRDLDSIEEAFRRHSLWGSANAPVVGSSCCCTCTPACCCTAVAVVKAAA
ncbi:hypothetical protein G3N57_05230 [Paraburkholderia sp. Se-20369]|nr:hypothetical protein [Paraburkholderia sp. Se-20369]TCW84003.1 hypothetical protein C5O80_13010 [Burkholderia sp. SRS-46]